MVRSVGILLAICWLGSVSLPAQEKKGGEQFQPTSKETKLLELLNAERKKADLPLLKLHPVLTQVARAHSANMARQEKMAHDLDGMTPFDRVKKSGYRYLYVAENIAWGTPEIGLPVLVKGWMDSESHRKNLLNKVFVETGLGMGTAKDGSIYYTQVFGQPRR